MSRAGFGQAGQGFFLDPGDELVGLEVVGQGPGEGGLLLEAGALLYQLGGADQGLLGGGDFVGQGSGFRPCGCRVPLPFGSLGFDGVDLVPSDWRREEAAF